jgi:hypothetical protein
MSYTPAPPTPPPVQPAPHARNGFGTTGFVLGLLAVLFSWIPFVGVIGWPLAVLGLIFGGLGLRRVLSHRADNKGLTIAGIVLSLLGLLICILWATAFASAVSTAGASGTVTAPAAAAGADAAAPQNVAAAGQAIDENGVRLTTTKLVVTHQQYAPEQMCTTASYVNTGSTQTSYNQFDWKLQTPAGAILSPGISFSDPSKTLNSGQLAPGGKVSGTVCWDTPATSGTYQVQHQGSIFANGPQAVWQTTR